MLCELEVQMMLALVGKEIQRQEELKMIDGQWCWCQIRLALPDTIGARAI